MNDTTRTLLLKVSDPSEVTSVLTKAESEKLKNNYAEIEVKSIEKIPGIGSTEFTIELVFSISTGVVSSLIASWIFSKLMKPNERKIYVSKEKRILIKKEDVEILIEEMEKEISTKE